MSIIVRRATPEDAADLSRLGAATFQETFGGENMPDDMVKYVAGAFTIEQQAAEIADPASVVLVAEHAGISGKGELVGYSHLVDGDVPPAVSGHRPIELKRLYVARAWHGRRVAQALMDATIAAAVQQGALTLWLGVWERNTRAVAFYAKYGFTRVGEHTFVLGDDAQTDWLLSRPIGLDH